MVNYWLYNNAQVFESQGRFFACISWAVAQGPHLPGGPHLPATPAKQYVVPPIQGGPTTRPFTLCEGHARRPPVWGAHLTGWLSCHCMSVCPQSTLAAVFPSAPGRGAFARWGEIEKAEAALRLWTAPPPPIQSHSECREAGRTLKN